MKKIVFAILCLVCALGAKADQTVTWISRTHDFGAFDEDTKKKTAIFRFVNTTSEPVCVVSATATCGCTVPKYSNDDVAPGDTATIEVSYDPSGRPGRFEKQVYVRTSDSPERVKLLIKGTVIGNPETIKGRYPVSMGPLSLRNGAAMFGRAYSGKDKVAYVDGYNLSQDTITPTLVYAPAWIDVVATPKSVAPGEMMSLDVVFKGEECTQWGILTDSVMIAPNPGAKAYALPVVIIVEEDFSKLTPQQLKDAPVASLSSDRLELQPVPVNSVSAVTGTLRLTNNGTDPLLIRRLFSEDPGVDVSSDALCLKQKESADIKVTFDPSVQPTGIINARFTLITNDPLNPTQVVRVVAERR